MVGRDSVRRRLRAALGAILDVLQRTAEQGPLWLSWLSPATAGIREIAAQRATAREYCLALTRDCNEIPLPLSASDALYPELSLADVFVDLPIRVVQKQQLITFETGSGDRPGAEQPADVLPTSVIERRRDPSEVTSIGDRLGFGKRVVLIGERGSGKTTLLKWIAFAYSLNELQDNDSARQTWPQLPRVPWLPVLIRCGDLRPEVLEQSFEDVLREQFRKLPYPSEWVSRLIKVVFSAMARSRAILLVDGLDELPTLGLREKFCDMVRSIAGSYPEVPMVLTSLSSSFNPLAVHLGQEFELVRMVPLRPAEKSSFASRWAASVHPGDNNAGEFAEQLRAQLNGSRTLARLTENIQLLTLVVQLYRLPGDLPDRSTQIFKKAVEALLQRKSRSGTEMLTWNEVTPQLEFLAYEMRRRGLETIAAPKMLELFGESRKVAPRAEETERRRPAEFLDLIVECTGLLVEAGIETDHGLDNKVYRFVHSSFHDFFAAQAIKNGRYVQHDQVEDPLQHLVAMLADCPIEEQRIRNIDSWDAKEFVFVEQWQGAFKQYIADLPEGDADEALFGILQPSVHARPGEGRARAVLAAACLADEPHVTQDTAGKIINTLIDNIRHDVDGRSELNTTLDEAVHALTGSKWVDLLRSRLIDVYIESRGDVRYGVGAVLSATINDLPEASSVRVEDVRAMLSASREADVKAQVWETLRLVSFAFLNPGWFGQVPPGAAHELLDDLFARLEDTDPISSASMWAIGWIVQARYAPLALHLRNSQIDCLIRFLDDETRDPVAMYWAALCLSCVDGAPEHLDWVVEWALVAGGIRPWRLLPKREPTGERQEIIRTLVSMLTPSIHSSAREGAALSLGRLGVYHAAAADDLIRIFCDGARADETRREAIGYLVQIGGPQVARSLTIILQTHGAGDETIRTYTFLALIGMGTLSILEELVLAGPEAQTPGARRAAAITLAGHTDPRARFMLKSLADSSRPEVRQAAREALAGVPSDEPKHLLLPQALLDPETTKQQSPGGQVILESVVCILLVRGENPDAQPIYAYVAVRADKVADFMGAQKKGVFYPEDFGVIVEAGTGEPSPEVRKRMEDGYGFDHGGMVDL
jgi:HEAT repeat protein/energy-coupling factor transporter ATP-binding protein EcfA2